MDRIARMEAIAERRGLSLKQVFNEECFRMITEEDFDADIDESQGGIILCGIGYSPSFLLKEANPIHYNCSYADFVDSMDGVEFEGEYYYPDEIDEWIDKYEVDETEK